MLPSLSFGQVNYTENFNASGGGWTGFNYFTGATTCGGSGGAQRYNLFFESTAALTSPMVGTSVGGNVSMSYDYKVAVWSANTTGQSGDWGFFDVQYASSPTGPWTTEIRPPPSSGPGRLAKPARLAAACPPATRPPRPPTETADAEPRAPTASICKAVMPLGTVNVCAALVQENATDFVQPGVTETWVPSDSPEGPTATTL